MPYRYWECKDKPCGNPDGCGKVGLPAGIKPKYCLLLGCGEVEWVEVQE